MVTGSRDTLNPRVFDVHLAFHSLPWARLLTVLTLKTRGPARSVRSMPAMVVADPGERFKVRESRWEFKLLYGCDALLREPLCLERTDMQAETYQHRVRKSGSRYRWSFRLAFLKKALGHKQRKRVVFNKVAHIGGGWSLWLRSLDVTRTKSTHFLGTADVRIPLLPTIL
jgi:hypothetical protein